MNKSLLRTLLFLIICTLSLLINQLHAQTIIRDYNGLTETDPNVVISGCGGIAVEFSVSPTPGHTYSNYQWRDIENGVLQPIFSTLAEPFEQFNTTGFYSMQVTFDDYDGSSTTTRTISLGTNVIEVYNQPDGSFYADQLGICPGGTIQLTQTTPGTFTSLSFLVDNRLYAIDPLNPSDPVSVTLNNPGDYDVVLSGVTTDGCQFIRRETDYIHVEKTFTTTFFASQNLSCAPTQNVTFFATSTDNDGGIVSPVYYWDFGDGTLDTTSVGFTTHLFDRALGTDFTVTVNSISNNCPGTTTNTIDISFRDITTLYTPSVSGDCNDYMVTYTPGAIDPLLTGMNVLWDFGDGSATEIHSIGDVVTHSFLNPNPTAMAVNVTAEIIGVPDNSCQYTDSRSVPVLPQAGITISSNDLEYCNENFNVIVEATSLQNVSNFYWVLDGNTSNPIGNNAMIDTIAISGFGDHTIELYFDSGNPVNDCSLNSIDVYSNPINVSVAGPALACEPASDTFFSSTTWTPQGGGGQVPIPFSVDSEEWMVINTGLNDTTYYSTNPLSFTNLGHGDYTLTYTVILDSIGDNPQCSYSSIPYLYEVGEVFDNPTINFSPATICIGTTVNFSTTTTADTTGLGLSGAYPILYQYRYASNLDWVDVGPSGNGSFYYGDIVDSARTALPGFFQVELRAIINNCAGAPSAVNIRIEPAEAEHDISVDECNPTILGFVNNSLGTPDTDYQWTLTITPPALPAVTWSSDITDDENWNFLAEPDFPLFSGYSQGEIPENSVVDIRIQTFDNGCNDTEDTTITMPGPLPVLAVNPFTSTGTCINSNLTFDAGDGNLGTNYAWTFTHQTEAGVVETFASNNSTVNTVFSVPGNYNGEVVVTTAGGCSFTQTFGPIHMTGGAVSINGPTNGCVGDTFTFEGINIVYSPSDPMYIWKVDGATVAAGIATGGNIPDLTGVTFSSPNTPTQATPHEITLELTVNGCTADYTHDIIVTQPDFDFPGPSSNYISFDYVCDEIVTVVDLQLDTTEVYNLSTANITFDLGGPALTPLTQFEDSARLSIPAGTYTMNVTVEDEFGCTGTDNITFTVPVFRDLAAGFTPNTVNLVCPGFVSFDDSAFETPGNTTRRQDLDNTNTLYDVDIATWQWDFDNDGTIDATTTVGNVAHYYDRPGSYKAVVTVTDDHGCQDTSSPITITVGGTSGSYEILKKIGFEPATTTMVAFPVNDPNTDITNTIYQWSSGNGQLGLDSAQMFVYDSTIAGANMSTITPNLTFLDENGCSYPADWSGDMTILNCPNISNPDIVLCTDEGAYNLSVADMSWGGDFNQADTIETADYIYRWELQYRWSVDGVPISQINGGHDPDVTFNFGSAPTNPWIIDPDVATGRLYNIQATIIATYIDKHNAANNNTSTECTMNDNIRVIYNPTPVAVFTNDEVCGGTPTTLDATATNFGAFVRGSISNYEWDIDNDGTYDYNVATPTVSHTFPGQGAYPVTLRVTSADGCDHLVSKDSVIVNSVPVGDYAYNNVCQSYGIQFTNLSTIVPVTDDEIVRWDWDFNNNGTFDFGGTDSLVHRDPLIGVDTLRDNYGTGALIGSNLVLRPRLTVTTNKGCTFDFIPIADSLLVFSFNEPTANLSAKRDPDSLANQVCLGQVFEFKDLSLVDNTNIASYISSTVLPVGVNDITAWQWDFDDGNTSTSQNPIHTYTSEGTYVVKLRVTTARGCTDIDSITVNVRENPDPEIGVDSLIVCDDQTVNLRPIANDSINFAYTWSKLSGPTNGTVIETNLNSHNATVDVNESNFNAGQSVIDIKYQLEIVDNNHLTACTRLDTVDVQFHRFPNIDLDTTLVSCGTSASYVALPFGAEIINGFTYSWTQVYLTGGTVNTTNNSLQNFTVTPDTYNSGSTRIRAKYYIDVTNAIGCTDRDSIEFEFFRQPEYSSYSSNYSLCNNPNRSLYELDVYPFGTTESLPHNTAYDYTWSMSTNSADHNMDPLFISALNTQVTTNTNMQNIDLDILEDYFKDDSVRLWFQLDLRVENSYDNTCFKDTSFIIEIERRPKDFTVTDPRVDPCNLSVTLNHHTENLAFNYRWRPDAITSGYDGVIGDLPITNDQSRTLTFTDSDFSNGASEFTLEINHRIRKKLDPYDLMSNTDDSPHCGLNKDYFLTFYRTPNIVFTDTWPSGNTCATSMILSSGSEVISGFNYSWVQTSVSNGTVVHDATTNKDINLSVGSWNPGQSVISVTYELTVTNAASPTCQDVQSYTFEFHRTPELSYNPTPLNCALIDTVSVNSDALSGATFVWTQNALSGGTLNTTDNGDEFIIEVDNFGSTDHRIDANFTVNISNSTLSTCDNDTTFDISFFRTPDIVFSDTRTDSCALVNEVKPFGTNVITGYNYQWRELYVNGGTISTNALTDQNLTFTATSFDQDTAYIDVAYELFVENSDATGCVDMDTIYMKFYRTPNLNVFRKIKPLNECGLSVELYPLDTVEVINHTEGFNYTWTLDAATVTGTPSNVLPTSVLTDLTAKVNDQNFNLTMPITAFDAGSNEIQFELDLHIEHSATGVTCSKDSTILLSFKRPPVIDILEVKADSCALSTELRPFGTETIPGFNYDWEVVSITNYANTVYAAGQTFSSQNLNVNLVDSDFTPTESKITMIVSLEVQNQLASSDSSCIDMEMDTLIFYRTPQITSPFLSMKVNACDHTATSEPFATNVNGFGYVWTKVSETDGSVVNTSLTDRQITVSLDTFATNSLQVDAQYRLRVFNIDYPSCYDEETVDFEFYRTPELRFDQPMSYCASIDSVMTFRTDNEAFTFNGSQFFWNLNSITGGTIDSTASGPDVFTIDVASFDTDAAQIDAEYTVSITNPSTHLCDDDTTFQVTFFRTPEITFASTKTDSCALNDVIQPFNGENIPLFTRNWRQLSVVGGTITQNSTATDLDLNVTANTFDLHSTTITVQYELTATNSVSTLCTDIDTVEFYFYRTPDYTNYDDGFTAGNCGGTFEVFPLGTTEVINHNNGFDYQWTLDGTSVTGAGADGNTLVDDISNYITANQNSQNLSLSVADSAYEDGAHILSFDMDLDITHSNTNITCAAANRTVTFEYFRYPDINFTEIKADSCDLNTTIQPFGAEVIPGFTYNWEIQSIDGYDGSTYSVGDTFTTQNTSFTVTDADFDDAESVIKFVIELTAVNSSASADVSCQNTQNYTFYFYRTPQIKTNFLSTKTFACNNEGVASPFNTHINGFVYQWSLDSMSTKGGEVTGVVTDDSHLAGRELTVQIDSFTDQHSIMKAYYKLRVINASQPTCYDEDTVSFEFFRTPEVSLSSLTGTCQNAVLITSTNEMLYDIDFDWMQISESGGTVITNPTNHDGNREITFTATDYDPGSSEINSTYMITLLNSGESMCDDDTTFDFTLYRHPEINLVYTRATADSCSNALTITPFANEGIAGFTNNWTEVSRTGGTITTSMSAFDEDLTITLDTFEINSTRIDTRYLLTSFNTNSVACEDTMSLSTTLYRQADFTEFTETRADGICGMQMTLSPLGLVENIPHNTGFDYTWSYDSLNVTGADNDILPLSVINSFYSQVNDQNLSLSLPLSAFAAGSNKIEIPVTISIENTDQNSCVNAFTHTMIFYRPPVIDIQQSLAGCGISNLITSFGSENVASAFTFTWSYTTIGGTVTNTSLSAQNLTLNNPGFNSGSDTVRINVALNVMNNENTTCQADTSFTFLFYKQPDITFTQSLVGCDSVNLIRPFGAEVLSGFTYTWDQLQLSGGQLDISPTYSLSTQDLQLEKLSFDVGSHRIDAEYKLTVSNTDTTGVEVCNDVDSTTFTMYRVPEIDIQQSLVPGTCGNTNTITTFGLENITGFLYQWNLQSVVGGNVSISSTTTQDVTFDSPIFDPSSNRIDVVYNVTVQNSDNTTCSDIETVSFTFFRTPDATITPIAPVCSSSSILLTTSESHVTNFNYLWTLLNTTVDYNPSAQPLVAPAAVQNNNTYTLNSPVDIEGFFPSGSSEITFEYEVSVENMDSPGCTDKDTIEATFFRVPILKSTQSLDSTNCELMNIVRPFGTEEIPNYTYNWTELSVSGGSIQVSYLDAQNQNALFTVDSFDSLSHRIDVSYRLIVTNNSGACTGNETFNFTFFRTPQIDLARLNPTPTCKGTDIVLFPEDVDNPGFTYQWTPISVTSDNGIDLLASSITPIESSLTDHTLTLSHNPSFPQTSVRVTAIYELEVTNADNGCNRSEQITVIFDREAMLSLVANNFSTCDDNDLTLTTVEPRTDNYVYTWNIGNIVTDNNAAISTLSSINTATVGSMTLNPDPSDFPDGSALITARFDIHAENQMNADCDADTSYTVNLARKPIINFTDDHSGCALDTVTVKAFGDEAINGFNYNWSIVNIDGFNGVTSSILSGQQNNQNIEVHFSNSDFSNGRSQIEVTFELTATNPNESGCSDTQQHTLVFFRVPEIAFTALKAGNDSCANQITISPFSETVSDYQYQWTLLNSSNGTASEVNNTSRDLVVNNPIFDNGETQIDLRYELEITNSNPSAPVPCVTTDEITVSFFRTPILRSEMLTAPYGCDLNASLKGLQLNLNTGQENNYTFDWTINSLSGGTVDTTSNMDSLHLAVTSFDTGSGEVNIDLDLDAHNTYQYNTCFANENRALTFYRTPVVNLTPSATDLCETAQFNITTGEELVTHFDYDWTLVITDDIGSNTGTVDTTSNGSRGHALRLNNPIFPVGASYIEIEATLMVSNGTSGCTDTETTTIRFHKQPVLNITANSPTSCDDNLITLRPTQDEVVNFVYAWERLSIDSDVSNNSGADIQLSSTSDYQITLDNPSFPSGSAEISAWYKLTVSNPVNPYCVVVSDSIEVTFYRSPITGLGVDYQVSCDSMIYSLNPASEEFIANFNYAWSITNLETDKRTPDASASVNLTNNGTYTPTIEVTQIPADASYVRATVQLTTSNTLNSCGTSTDEKEVTFIRTPTVTLPNDMADCQERVFMLSPDEDEWTGMDYEWEIIHSTGGQVTTQNNMNSYLASISDPVFNSNSFFVSNTVVLRVNNKLDDSCVIVDTMNVTFHRTPLADFTVDKGFGCQGETIYFSTRNSEVPQSGSVYQWDFDNDGHYETTSLGDTTYTFNSIGTQTVSMRIVTPAGCISPAFSDDVHIYEIPTPRFTFGNICIGETAQFINTTPQLRTGGDHGIKSVKWDFDYNEQNGAIFDAYNTDASFQYPEAGTFKILVEVTNNGGCTNTYVDSITVTPLPVITIPSDIWICEGLTTTLSPTIDVPVTYSWSTGETNQNITVGPLEDETYTLTVTNAQGCINTKDINVHVIPALDTEFTLESCETVPITFDARIPQYDGVIQTFEWSNGETTPTIDVLSNGTYTVRSRIQHESGTMCEFVHEFDATFYPNPERVLQDTTFCFEFGDLLQVGAVEGDNFTYSWDNGETSRVVTRDRSGVYTVLITDETHVTRCTTIDTIVVNQICPARMNTPNAFSPNGDGINDEFLLEPAYAIDIDFHVYNNWGESIFHREYKTSQEASTPGNGWNGKYKGADMMSGSYTFTIRYTSEKDGSVTERSGQIILLR